jgi:hypothetical protein
MFGESQMHSNTKLFSLSFADRSLPNMVSTSSDVVPGKNADIINIIVKKLQYAAKNIR